jgi:uncharacterized protein YeaO (DUF488 family)
MIMVKRVYELPGRDDGARFLVDRLWPRGVKRETLRLEGWYKEAAPSAALRRWFGHDPKKWKVFRERYRAELADQPVVWRPLLEAARRGDVTLLYAARDLEHNNAVVLAEFLNVRVGME